MALALRIEMTGPGTCSPCEAEAAAGAGRCISQKKGSPALPEDFLG